MPQDALISTEGALRRGPIVAAVLVIALALGGTLMLWAHYGTAVFFETIRAGFAACFG